MLSENVVRPVIQSQHCDLEVHAHTLKHNQKAILRSLNSTRLAVSVVVCFS